MKPFLRFAIPVFLFGAYVGCSSDPSTGTSTTSASSSSSGNSSSGSSSSGGGTVVAPPEGDATYGAITAAEALLTSLDEAQRTAISFDFSDDAQRAKWSNFPTGIFQRNGVKLGAMTQAQQDAVFKLLEAILSAKGYKQVVDTVNADEALKNSGGGGMLIFGKAEYYVSILGTPSATSPWMVQFGGHHLAVNATIVGGDITLAPSLTGAQPATYVLNGVTIEPQGLEIDAAFALIGALSVDEQSKAIIGANYIDLVLGPGKDNMTIPAEGIIASELSAANQAFLRALIAERVEILNDEDAALRMKDIDDNFAQTYFAWSGPTAAGSAAYWRVTGPTIFIEYSPQSMGGSATDHTHAMYRDPTNDYAKAWLK